MQVLGVRAAGGDAAGVRAREVLADQAHRQGTDAATRAAQAWLAERSEEHRAAAVEALQAIAPER